MAKQRAYSGFLCASDVAPETPEYVVVELQHDCQIAHSRRGFCAASEREEDARSLNSILENFDIRHFRSHFGMHARSIRKRVTEAPPSLRVPVPAEFAHAGFVQIVPEKGEDCEALARRMNRHPWVWKAFVAPRVVFVDAAAGDGAKRPPIRPTQGHINFEASQGYLYSPPNGIGAMEVWPHPGGRGEGISVCDIQGNWNRKHEDLPRRIRLLGGTPVKDVDSLNHGTATLGTMVSRPGKVGTVGICHRTRAVVQCGVKTPSGGETEAWMGFRR